MPLLSRGPLVATILRTAGSAAAEERWAGPGIFRKNYAGVSITARVRSLIGWLPVSATPFTICLNQGLQPLEGGVAGGQVTLLIDAATTRELMPAASEGPPEAFASTVTERVRLKRAASRSCARREHVPRPGSTGRLRLQCAGR